MNLKLILWILINRSKLSRRYQNIFKSKQFLKHSKQIEAWSFRILLAKLSFSWNQSLCFLFVLELVQFLRRNLFAVNHKTLRECEAVSVTEWIIKSCSHVVQRLGFESDLRFETKRWAINPKILQVIKSISYLWAFRMALAFSSYPKNPNRICELAETLRPHDRKPIVPLHRPPRRTINFELAFPFFPLSKINFHFNEENFNFNSR